MNVEITWYGHSCFRIAEAGVSVLIDPFITGNPICPIDAGSVPTADIIAVTHEHGDHIGDAAELANRMNAVCVCVVGTQTALFRQGLKEDLIPFGTGINIGGSFTLHGMRITMTQAFHTSDSGTPVGYIITMPGGFTVYHAGDTGMFGDMALIGELYRPNLALLPCGGVYTMDARQAAYACRLLNVSAVIPMHWGTFPALASDTSELNSCLLTSAPRCRHIKMVPGETITF